jgi:UDP-N-acetylmuramate--alanine ligase
MGIGEQRMIPSTRIKRVHFIGIGGSGMSGIAEVLHQNGFVVSGSDMKGGEVVEYLRNQGVQVHIGHDAKYVLDSDVVVYSSAVKMDNPEIVQAKLKNIPVIRRAEMLGELMRLKYTIAIAGTHGKTTTTSMIGSIFYAAEKDPTIIVGGILKNMGTGARLGQGDILIAEADEYDRSFLSMMPTLALVTNVEEDHLDCYENLEDIKSAFIQFLNKVPFYGQIVVCIDEPGVQDILPMVQRPVVTYGFSKQADYRIGEVQYNNGITSFVLYNKTIELPCFSMKLTGRHNVLNAAGAVAVALEEGILPETIRKGLADFGGVRRRMEFLGKFQQAEVYDDYAHHPTEVSATLQGLRDVFKQKRIFVVFQPHLYSRTVSHYKNFAAAFVDCDEVIIAPIYGAREAPIEGVDGSMISMEATRRGHKHALYIDEWDDIVKRLQEICKEDDIVLLMGAGDIWKLSQQLLGINNG